MSTEPTPEQLREFAARLVREAHDDYDFMGIGEQMSDAPELRDLDEVPFSEAQTRISNLIRSAAVTVSWPDEQPQDERDVRIAQLERELRDLRGTELNPSPLMLDAQAYGYLRDEIAATMADDAWDLDGSESWILVQYVKWLAAGQPRYENGWPAWREGGYPAAEDDGAQDERDCDVRPDAFDLDCEELVEIFADFIGQWDRSHEVITVGLPDHLPQLRIPHLSRAVLALQRLGRERDAAFEARDGDVRAVAALLDVLVRADQRNRPKVLHGPIADLRARFANRIAVLEARDSKAGE